MDVCQRIRRLTKKDEGVAPLNSVMILAVSALVLLGMRSLWDAKSGSGSVFSALDRKFAIIFNGGRETPGPLSSGDHGGVGETGPHDTTTGDTNSENGGQGDDGTSSEDDKSSDDGPTDPDNEDSTDDDKDAEDADEDGDEDRSNKDEKNKGSDEDPLWNDTTQLLVKFAVEGTKNEQLKKVADVVQAARKGLGNAKTNNEIARKLLEAARNNPNSTILEKARLSQALSNSNRAVQKTRDLYQNARRHAVFVKSHVDRFSKAVGALGAVSALVDADRKRAELIRDGKFQEAYRLTVSASSKYLVDMATTFSKKFPGIGGIIKAEVLAKSVEVASHQLADDTFPAMVDVSHWLYKQRWWPRDRPPRFPPGYDPRKKTN